MLEDSEQVGALIAHLQSLRGQQLWAAQSAAGAGAAADDSTLPTLVNSVVAAMFFQSDLRERWAAEALQWLLESCNPQHVTLSHQVCAAAVSPKLRAQAQGALSCERPHRPSNSCSRAAAAAARVLLACCCCCYCRPPP
jgi:hypothetical protein